MADEDMGAELRGTLTAAVRLVMGGMADEVEVVADEVEVEVEAYEVTVEVEVEVEVKVAVDDEVEADANATMPFDGWGGFVGDATG